ncbi:MAG TPA: GTP-binding protein [Mycobacteriales bacterium]|nr:GTP-binding protein [Mycobacteriales bacterium]
MESLLRVATAGSVDDGKSTLVGRLLHDAKAVFADQLAAVEHASRRRGYDEADLALLVDGLRAEREQGITIDVAYRYFATPRRTFVLADTPGHIQYTRNMVTGASTADVAIVLVDARKGLVEQSRRHATIAALLRVRHVVLAVNKMDLVGFAEEVFDEILADFAALAERRSVRSWSAVPISALLGDNVVDRSAATPWYAGPPLLEHLETLDIQENRELPAEDAAGEAAAEDEVRFPVQLVIRPRRHGYADFRGYAGRVEAGTLRPGTPVTVLPSGQASTVAAIDTADGPLAEAGAGRSVVVRLADDVDVSRGDLLVAGRPPSVTRELAVTVCWLAEEPLRPGGRYRIRHTTREVRAVVEPRTRLDVSTSDSAPTDTLALNDIGQVLLRTAEPLVVDPYSRHRATGALLIVDETSGATVAAGMVEGAR